MLDIGLEENHQIVVVYGGRDFTDGNVIFVSKTMKMAIDILKRNGCKYNKSNSLWSVHGENYWYEIRKEDYIK